uniref:Uncharacterized protein n=1 Tax=Siphoviridae sp. ctAkS7 TaxID=2827798 RepID=A0A8S5SXI1_9CAUD|nr:MAG TPA: hypothetical protein [Siphoviridae sp. ctAkS7]
MVLVYPLKYKPVKCQFRRSHGTSTNHWSNQYVLLHHGYPKTDCG